MRWAMIGFCYMKSDLTIIIPVYNEEKTVLAMLHELVETKELKQYGVQYIVVDDGSTDETKEQLIQTDFKNDERFLFLFHEVNKGKGSAIRTALPYAKGEYTIIQDADLEYRPADIAPLLHRAQTEKLQAVYGSRNLIKGNLRGTPFFYWGGKAVTWVANILFGQRLTDEPTCYKLVKTETLISLPLLCKRFEYCQEVTALLSLRKICIHEVPISYTPRSIDEGKKIRMTDGIKGVWTLVRVRFTAWNISSLFLLLFLGAGLLYTLTWHARFGGYEGETMRSALSLFDGTVDIKRAGVGAVMLYTPFIFLLKVLGIDIENHLWYLSSIPIFYSALTVGFIFLATHLLTYKKSFALFIGMCALVASPVWPYTNIGMEYQTTLALALLICALVAWSRNSTKPLLVGLAFAFLISVKSYGIVFGIPLLVFVLIELHKQKKYQLFRSVPWLLKFVVPPACVLGIIMSLNMIMYGTVSGKYSLVHEFQIWTWWEGIYGIFFSAGKSIFLYAPLLIATLFYWKQFLKEHTSMAVFLLISFCMLFGLTAPFSYWSDETWGVRKLIPIIPFLYIPLFYFVKNNMSSGKLFWGTIIFLCALYIQLIGSLFGYGTYLAILKQGNMDSLQHMRFIPQTSHIVINHSLLTSVVGIGNHVLTYKEASWFRWLQPGQQDVVFKNSRVDLTQFHALKVFWFQPLTNVKLVLFTGMLGVLVLCMIILGISYRTHSRYENNNEIL